MALTWPAPCTFYPAVGCSDVLAYLAGEDPVVAAAPAKEASVSKPAPVSTGPVRLTDGPRHTDVPAGAIRKIIANRLTESKVRIAMGLSGSRSEPGVATDRYCFFLST